MESGRGARDCSAHQPPFRPGQGELKITADQITPTAAPLEVTYDPAMGWHRIDLRNDTTGQPPYNDRIERVRLTIDNPSTSPRIARLCFAKGLPREGGVFGITGISAMLRDTDGSPLGIPIQISKNWHTNLDRYMGPWYRGLTMLTIPPRQKIELEYTSVNALWGGIPAASHAQLCLVGWGSNQLWEEAAIGSWGESICFEPDQVQAGAAVLDTRPLMVWAMGKQPKAKWGWTANVGGADFLGYYDPSGNRQWNSRMKAMRRRGGPVLTDTAYVGESRDGNIRLRYSASLYRTNDITRGVYRFRYDVRKPTPFSRLVFFQCGSENYSYTGERKFAYGNEDGLAERVGHHLGRKHLSRRAVPDQRPRPVVFDARSCLARRGQGSLGEPGHCDPQMGSEAGRQDGRPVGSRTRRRGRPRRQVVYHRHPPSALSQGTAAGRLRRVRDRAHTSCLSSPRTTTARTKTSVPLSPKTRTHGK